MSAARPHAAPVTFGLVDPAEPGNVGAAARSLSAFGFSRLLLFTPASDPDALDRALAARGGHELLAHLQRVSEAESPRVLSGFDEIWGTSARLGRRRRPETPAAAIGDYLARDGGELLILVGTERDGLSRVWLDRCHRLIRIPTRDRPLNLAHAVTVMAYEFCRSAALPRPPGVGDARAATPSQRAELLRRAGALLERCGYPTRDLPGHPPSAHLEPLRSGRLTESQLRWLLGLIARLEEQLP